MSRKGNHDPQPTERKSEMMPTSEEVEYVADHPVGMGHRWLTMLRQFATLLRRMEGAGTPATDALTKRDVTDIGFHVWVADLHNLCESLESQLRAVRAITADGCVTESEHDQQGVIVGVVCTAGVVLFVAVLVKLLGVTCS